MSENVVFGEIQNSSETGRMQISDKPRNQREQEILQEIRLAGGTCRISYLAQRLGVTNETIRRNLRTLEESRAVRKVHGGVHLSEDLNEPPLSHRMDTNSAVKQRLAAAAADVISDGDSLFLDIGSTTAYVARALQRHQNLYIVTNSIYVAQILATRNNNRVFLASGELRPHDGGAFGAEALRFLKGFNVQFAVLSVGAINADQGFMLHDLEEANIARLAIAQAQTRIVVADHEKFDRRAPVALASAKEIDVLITDRKPSPPVYDTLTDAEVELVIAG